MAITTGKYNFKKDIVAGEEGEDIIKELLIERGFVFINKNNDNKYDLKMSYGDKIRTYEIKTDMYARDTGNIVIEFECRGKPSGIAVTEADYFVTYFYHFGEIWNIKTSKLKKLIEEENPYIFAMAGDDNSGTKLYCFKKDNVREHFKIYKI